MCVSHFSTNLSLCISFHHSMSVPLPSGTRLSFSMGSVSVVLCGLHLSLPLCLSSKLCVSVSVWVTISSSQFRICVSPPPARKGVPPPLTCVEPGACPREGPGQRDAQRRLRLQSLRAGGDGRRAGATSTPRALPLGRAASTGRSRRGATGPASAAGGLRRAGTSSPWGGASSAAGAASSLTRSAALGRRRLERRGVRLGSATFG